MRYLSTLAVLLAVTAPAAQTATQNVTIVVDEINEIAVSGAVTLTINSASAGSAPTADTDASSSYAVTTNSSAKKITGQLGSDYQSGITLQVALAAPTGAASAGAQTLSSGAAVDLVSSMETVSEGGLTITYTASATADAAPNGAGETEVVTFTVTDE